MNYFRILVLLCGLYIHVPLGSIVTHNLLLMLTLHIYVTAKCNLRYLSNIHYGKVIVNYSTVSKNKNTNEKFFYLIFVSKYNIYLFICVLIICLFIHITYCIYITQHRKFNKPYILLNYKINEKIIFFLRFSYIILCYYFYLIFCFHFSKNRSLQIIILT